MFMVQNELSRASTKTNGASHEKPLRLWHKCRKHWDTSKIPNSQIFSIFEGLEELHDEVTVRLRHDVFLRHDVLLLSRFDDLCFLHLLQRKRAWCVVFNLHEFNATETADALKMGKETLVRWKSSVRHNALEWKHLHCKFFNGTNKRKRLWWAWTHLT